MGTLTTPPAVQLAVQLEVQLAVQLAPQLTVVIMIAMTNPAIAVKTLKITKAKTKNDAGTLPATNSTSPRLEGSRRDPIAIADGSETYIRIEESKRNCAIAK